MAKKYTHSAAFIAKQKAKAKALESNSFIRQQFRVYQERYYKEAAKVDEAGLTTKRDILSYQSFRASYIGLKNEMERTSGKKITKYEISQLPKEIADRNVYTYSREQAKAIRTALEERIGRYSETKQKHTYISQFKEEVLAERKARGIKGQYISATDIRAGGITSDIIKKYYHQLRSEGLSSSEAANEISHTFYGS